MFCRVGRVVVLTWVVVGCGLMSGLGEFVGIMLSVLCYVRCLVEMLSFEMIDSLWFLDIIKVLVIVFSVDEVERNVVMFNSKVGVFLV